MSLRRFVSILPIFVVLSGLFIQAQSPASATSRGLGKVSFPISCQAEVQPPFDKGLALLHSFQYAAAENEFNLVAQGDPQCAMAYWGLAMSSYHALWEGADQKAERKGHQYLEKARQLGTPDKREREYIEALSLVLTGG